MQKHFLITIAFFFVFIVNGKSQKLETYSATFKAVFADSIQYSKDKSFRIVEGLYNEFCIFKDNIKVPLPFLETKKGKKIKYQGLTKGDYVLRYENIFAQIVEKPFTISNKSIKNMPIRLDEFIDTVKMSFFEEMKNGDSLNIVQHVIGCFGGREQSIEITKENNVLNARLFDFIENEDTVVIINPITGLSTRTFKYDKPDKLFVKEKILSVSDITLMKDVFNRIEMLCRVVIFGKPEGTYYISLNGQLIKKLFDDSDEWDSFRILKDKIFAVKEKF